VRQRLQKELEATRKRGWALEEEETVPGVTCVAIPLTELGEPLAAVSVSVPIHRLSAARRSDLLKALVEFRRDAMNPRKLAAASA
jgi:DNA-binding IclR family transcriptional regulator